MSAPLYGLVLAGGRSTRMRRDKASLNYHGRTQLEWAMELIGPRIERAFASIRPDQQNDPVRARFECIIDQHADLGPIAGIVAAQAAHPEAAWLVLACDLPFVDAETLDHLVWARRPEQQATAYRSSHGGLPEPLCAIYEPSSRDALSQYIARGRTCPRKFLLQADTALLEEPNPRALDNINTPEEYGTALAQVQPRELPYPARGTPMQLKVHYYALLREQAGRSEETLS